MKLFLAKFLLCNTSQLSKNVFTLQEKEQWNAIPTSYIDRKATSNGQILLSLHVYLSNAVML